MPIQKEKSPRPAGTKGFRGATLIARTGGRSSSLDNRPRWWSWGDSNPRPPQCHCGALPAELQPQVCSDLSIAITGEPVVDYGLKAFADAAPRRVRSYAGPTPQRLAFTLPGSLSGRPTTPVRCMSVSGWKERFRAAGAGGAEGIRTPDLYSAIVALSQLSYSPGKEAKISLGEVADFVKFLKRMRIRCSGQDADYLF